MFFVLSQWSGFLRQTVKSLSAAVVMETTQLVLSQLKKNF